MTCIYLFKLFYCVRCYLYDKTLIIKKERVINNDLFDKYPINYNTLPINRVTPVLERKFVPIKRDQIDISC